MEWAADGYFKVSGDPKAGQAVKELLGIDGDYYVAAPPDPTDDEMEGVWATLRGLAKRCG